jgi:[ribosomal protein S18]-alanine N-acetyltransferase
MSVTPASQLRYESLTEPMLGRMMIIEHEAYPEPWTVGMFRDEIRSERSHFYVAFLGDVLVGYSGFWLILDEAHITSVTVAKEYRGRGFGRQQLEHLIDVGEEFGVGTYTLEVRESNLPARRLYESMDFRAVGVRKGYYAKTQEDAIIMSLDAGRLHGD